MELRETFDTVAEPYERARPTYPDELVDALPTPEPIRHVDADSCLELLGTYSGHIVMTEGERDVLFAEVRRLVGDGTISKHELFCLHVGRKVV